MTSFLTIVTLILELSREVFGLQMVPHIVPAYMSKLPTDATFPFCLPTLPHTELIQILRAFYMQVV